MSKDQILLEQAYQNICEAVIFEGLTKQESEFVDRVVEELFNRFDKDTLSKGLSICKEIAEEVFANMGIGPIIIFYVRIAFTLTTSAQHNGYLFRLSNLENPLKHAEENKKELKLLIAKKIIQESSMAIKAERTSSKQLRDYLQQREKQIRVDKIIERIPELEGVF